MLYLTLSLLLIASRGMQLLLIFVRDAGHFSLMFRVSSVRIMQSKLCRYSDERTLIVRSYMGEQAVYYIGACMSCTRPNQALVHATE